MIWQRWSTSTRGRVARVCYRRWREANRLHPGTNGFVLLIDGREVTIELCRWGFRIFGLPLAGHYLEAPYWYKHVVHELPVDRLGRLQPRPKRTVASQIESGQLVRVTIGPVHEGGQRFRSYIPQPKRPQPHHHAH